jgi:hypothetical protein
MTVELEKDLIPEYVFPSLRLYNIDEKGSYIPGEERVLLACNKTWLERCRTKRNFSA